MSLHATPTSPVVLTETRDLPATILSLGRNGIRLRVPGKQSLRGEVRVAFGADHMLLTEVATCSSDGSVTDLGLRYVAAWARHSRDQLGVMLTRVLRLPEIRIDAVLDRPSGWFYMFGRKAFGQGPAQEDPASQRKQARIPVRVAVDFTYAGSEFLDRGSVYNVSETGVGLLSDAPLPPTGTEVTIYFPISGSGPSGQATLKGILRWSIDGMGQGGGCGIQLTGIDDGASGLMWQQFVKNAADGASGLDIDTDGPITGHRDGLQRRPDSAVRAV